MAEDTPGPAPRRRGRPRSRAASVSVPMRLPAEVVESLDRVCRVRFCARTEVIRQALLEYLERHGCGANRHDLT